MSIANKQAAKIQFFRLFELKNKDGLVGKRSVDITDYATIDEAANCRFASTFFFLSSSLFAKARGFDKTSRQHEASGPADWLAGS